MFATSIALFVTTVQGQTVTLFSDNFESYSAGSNLAGQGGWTGCGSIPINSGTLPTQVARVDLGSAGCSGAVAGFAVINHSFSGSIATNAVTTLSFDAYAPNGSHNLVLWLTNLAFPDPRGVAFFTDNTVPGWKLGVYDNGSQLIIPGGTGTAVNFKVVIDVPNQILYVVYDFGSGPQTTSTVSLAGSSLSLWTVLSIGGDYRFGLPQGEIDNIRLTQVTTPLYHVCTLYDPTKAAKSGSTIPIKLQLCDGSGNNLSSPATTVHAVSITQTSTSISGPVEDSGNANPDSDFRFDSTLGITGGYILNLKTTGLATGSYNLNFTVTGDSAVYAAPFQVK